MTRGEPEAPRVAEWAADRALQLDPVEFAVAGLDVTLELLARHPGDQIDRATRGIAPVQRALRATQDLDAVDVEELREAHVGPAEIDAVERDGHARVGADAKDVRAHPADVDLRFAARLREGEARRLDGESFDVVDREVLEQLAGVGRDRDRHVLQ